MRREPPSAAVQAQPDAQTTRQASIRKKLAPRCGSATRWTPAQMREVAAAIEKNAADPGMVLLASEWRRQKRAIETCRGVAK